MVSARLQERLLKEAGEKIGKGLSVYSIHTDYTTIQYSTLHGNDRPSGFSGAEA